MLAYGRQFIDESDIAAVVEVLRSDYLTQGPAVYRFERAMASYCGAKYAVAVSSATAALHIGALALGLGSGDRLWTSPNTFVASANCALYCGAEVDFVDINPRTYNMDPEALGVKLEEAEARGVLPKIIVPVDFAGQSCEMAQIKSLAARYGCAVMEDASHAVGASYRGQPIGDGSHAELTVFSFHPVKLMTTGEGGMVLTNSERLYERLLQLRTHGITRDPRFMVYSPDGPWSYEQIELGFNYRLTDIQAALGESQLKKLPAFLARRRELAQRYSRLLSNLPIHLPWQHPDTLSSWHLYVIWVDSARARLNRLQLYHHLKDAGILCQVHYQPVHTQPYYQQRGFTRGSLPEAERYYSGALTLPLHFGLTDSDQDRVVAALVSALRPA